MKKLIVAFTAVLFSANILAQGIDFEQGTLQEALAKAKAENKLVFVDCYTDWCGPCKMLAKKIFPQKEVGDVYNQQFVSIKVNCEKGEGVDVANAYGVKAYPTLLFLDGSGQVIHKGVGGTDVPGMLELAKIATDPAKQIGTKHKKYAEGERDLAFLVDYVVSLAKYGENEKLTEVGQNFIANTPKEQLANVKAFTIIGYSKTLNYNSPTFNYIVTNKEKFINADGIGQENYDGVIGQCVSMYLNERVNTVKSIKKLEKEFNAIAEEYVIPRQEQVRVNLYNSFYLAHKQYDEWFDYNETRAKEMAETSKEDALYALNGVAFNVAMNKDFKEVEGAYDRAIELGKLALEWDAEFLPMHYCMAAIYKNAGNKAEALKHANIFLKAVKEKNLPDDPRVTKLVEEIESM